MAELSPRERKELRGVGLVVATTFVGLGVVAVFVLSTQLCSLTEYIAALIQ